MSVNDIRGRESHRNAEADAAAHGRILGQKAQADGWFGSVMDKLAEIGAGVKPQVKTASATGGTGPRMVPQMAVVDRGGVQGIVRDLGRIAETRSRSNEDAIAKAKDMVAKAASKLALTGADILFLRADISRWDDKSGQPQTGRLAFQIPFQSPFGDPRTIYANVDVVMGDLLPPRYFEDGLNKKYAFDESGLKEMLEGVKFDVMENPHHGTPEQKWRGPEVNSPDGVPEHVGHRGGIAIERRASVIVRTAAKATPPKRVAEGLVRSISRETMEAEAQPVSLPPTSPEDMDAMFEEQRKRKEKTNLGAAETAASNVEKPAGGYPSGDQTPGLSTLSRLAASAEEKAVALMDPNWSKKQKEHPERLTHEEYESLSPETRKKLEDQYGPYRNVQRRGAVKTAASAMDKAVTCLQDCDVRWLNFRDLVRILKQCGSEKEIAFESASKTLADEGIILFRTALEGPSQAGAVLRKLAHLSKAAIDGQVAEGGRAPADFQMPTSLGAVEMREWEELEDKRQKMWQDVLDREQDNRERQLPAYANIDYAPVQDIEKLMQGMIDTAKSRHDSEGIPAPSDVAIEEPASLPPPPGEGKPSGAPEESTLMPEKGMAAASPVRGIRKMADAADMKDKGRETVQNLSGLADSGVTAPGDKGAGEGRTGWPSSTGTLPQLAKANGTTKKAVQSLDNPEVCKACKWLIVPAEYSNLTEFKHKRLPFCGAPKTKGVGFEYAVFRDCAAYDPIVAGIPQKIETDAPKSQQTQADIEKVKVPSFKKAEALPSPNMGALDKFGPGHTGYGLDIRKWCLDGNHYAKAGEHHPTHDWCTLWNTAVENLVKLPSGAVLPKSLAFQSSESGGEGGPQQFGRSPNQ